MPNRARMSLSAPRWRAIDQCSRRVAVLPHTTESPQPNSVLRPAALVASAAAPLAGLVWFAECFVVLDVARGGRGGLAGQMGESTSHLFRAQHRHRCPEQIAAASVEIDSVT